MDSYNTESWKDIPGYEGLYKLSNFGRVKNKVNYIMKIGLDSQGYQIISLFKKGEKKLYRLSRLVWEAFCGDIPVNYQINHKNYIRYDNRLENLECITQLENIDYSKERISEANKNGNPKIKACDVLEIRKKYKTNKFTQIELAEQYGIKRSALSNIVNYVSWKHI